MGFVQRQFLLKEWRHQWHKEFARCRAIPLVGNTKYISLTIETGLTKHWQHKGSLLWGIFWPGKFLRCCAGWCHTMFYQGAQYGIILYHNAFNFKVKLTPLEIQTSLWIVSMRRAGFSLLFIRLHQFLVSEWYIQKCSLRRMGTHIEVEVYYIAAFLSEEMFCGVFPLHCTFLPLFCSMQEN